MATGSNKQFNGGRISNGALVSCCGDADVDLAECFNNGAAYLGSLLIVFAESVVNQPGLRQRADARRPSSLADDVFVFTKRFSRLRAY